MARMRNACCMVALSAADTPALDQSYANRIDSTQGSPFQTYRSYERFAPWQRSGEYLKQA